MSRSHARISSDGEGNIAIADLNTSNGTFVNRVRVESVRTLDNGDVIAIGDTRVVLDKEMDPDLLPASPTADGASVHEVIGTSFVADRLRRSLATVGPSPGSVLLIGETGTGKDVAANAIHRLSGRTGSWVPINCAAVPAELAESELFGHKKGAFTGAMSDRDGHFVRASGGTLFLDEIGDLPPQVQAKLLRVLEERAVQPLGGDSLQPVDVRIVAATQNDLDVRGFRKDLLSRLGDWLLHIPPLRDRRSDVMVLFEHFRTSSRKVTAEFAEALLLYDWPLNVRELRKLTLRLESLASSDILDITDLPGDIQSLFDLEHPVGELRQSDDHKKALPDRAALESALSAAKGNVSRAASELGCHRTQLYRLIAKFGLNLDDYR
jgi:two-component system NtrC family response regulator